MAFLIPRELNLCNFTAGKLYKIKLLQIRYNAERECASKFTTKIIKIGISFLT